MKTVVCFGASLTEGTVSANYVELLAGRPELAGFRFINHGVSGDLAWNGLQRLDKVIAEAPDFVTLLIGTNDVNATLSERNRLRYHVFNQLPIAQPTLAWYEENLRAIVGRLRTETQARLAFLTLPVIGEDLKHEANRQLLAYNEVICRVAREEDASLLPLYDRIIADLREHEGERAGLPPRLPYRDGLINIGTAIALHANGLSWDDVSRRNGLLLLTDCLHLNGRGAEIVAGLIAEWLEWPEHDRAET